MSTPRTYRYITNTKSNLAAGTPLDLTQAQGNANPGATPTDLLSGPTTARPKASDGDIPTPNGSIQAGVAYLDTTLGYVVVSDGNGAWRNPNSGSVV